MSKWRKITTAPKDKPILVYSQSIGCVIALYRLQQSPPHDGYTQWAVLWDGTYLARTPTHWMPLPEPPEATP